MSIDTTTQINFHDQARDARSFYESVFAGEATIATYADIHQVDDPAQADSVAWGQVDAPGGFRKMARAVQTVKLANKGQNALYMALRRSDAPEIRTRWEGLSDGAVILTALAPAVFAPLYRMLTDRFGVTWLVEVATPHNAEPE